MILKNIEYNEFLETPRHWSLKGFELGKINLIVGRNAVGKSRTLRIIKGLASLFANEKQNITEGSFNTVFEKSDGSKLKYCLIIKESKIIKETFHIDGKRYLNRGENGKGKIFAQKLQLEIDFQVSEDEVAVVKKRDAIQHPFLEELHMWGKSLNYYEFGSEFGKSNLAIATKDKTEELNSKNSKSVIAIFGEGKRKYGNDFVSRIKKDMLEIGYNISKIDVEVLPDFKLVESSFSNAHLKGIVIKEKDVEKTMTQVELSTGMFRAISLIIQVNYALLEKIDKTILIDDIGEGLDYDRSVALIKILIKKAKEAQIQLLMSTNDRFVMNNVNLEHWLVLNRKGSECKVFSHRNSKKVFENFKYTGLSNFDFLTSGFYLK